MPVEDDPALWGKPGEISLKNHLFIKTPQTDWSKSFDVDPAGTQGIIEMTSLVEWENSSEISKKNSEKKFRTISENENSEIVVHTEKKERKNFFLGVSLYVAPGKFQRTKIVELVPPIQLVNRSGKPIEIWREKLAPKKEKKNPSHGTEEEKMMTKKEKSFLDFSNPEEKNQILKKGEIVPFEGKKNLYVFPKKNGGKKLISCRLKPDQKRYFFFVNI